MSTCAGKVCEPHKDGRKRACNPETGRCKLVEAVAKKTVAKKTVAKKNAKPAKESMVPMTKKEVVAHLKKERVLNTEFDGSRLYGAVHVDTKLLAKLLDTPGKTVNLVVIDINSEFGVYLKEKSLEELTAHRFSDTKRGGIYELEDERDWDNYGQGMSYGDASVYKGSGPSDIVEILYTSGLKGKPPSENGKAPPLHSVVWLKDKDPAADERIGRYGMTYTWLK